MVKNRIYLSTALAVVGYFLGLVAEANKATDSPIYMASCFTKIIFYLISVPLANYAGKKSRKESNIIGIPGLRFASWIMYGVALIHFMTFFRWTADGSRLPSGQITIDSAIFFIASMLMNAEAWNCCTSKNITS